MTTNYGSVQSSQHGSCNGFAIRSDQGAIEAMRTGLVPRQCLKHGFLGGWRGLRDLGERALTGNTRRSERCVEQQAQRRLSGAVRTCNRPSSPGRSEGGFGDTIHDVERARRDDISVKAFRAFSVAFEVRRSGELTSHGQHVGERGHRPLPASRFAWNESRRVSTSSFVSQFRDSSPHTVGSSPDGPAAGHLGTTPK